MRLEQYRGPFQQGEIIEATQGYDYRYLHIGIQIPDRFPIEYTTDPLRPELKINDVEYKINECDILEFDGCREAKFTIEILRDLPWGTIIDLVYDSVEY